MTKLTEKDIKAYKEAGEIGKQVREYCKKNIKKGDKINDIAEKIEKEILRLGGEIGFPVNLAIDDVAAHFTPASDDNQEVKGLLKIDIGIHIDGFIADTALSLDLTDDNKYKDMIKVNEQALENAINLIKEKKGKIKQNEIGKIIHKTITDSGFSPIKNLSGHSIDQYEIHSGITIRNYDDGNDKELEDGIYAIEPFVTTGKGEVYEGKASLIYHLIREENKPRDPIARKVLEFIKENKFTLPFSERDIEKEFSTRTRLALKRLEQANIIESYPMLIEKSHAPVSQAEHTILIHKGNVEVLTG